MTPQTPAGRDGPTSFAPGFLAAVTRILESLGGTVEGFRGGYLIAGFDGTRHGLGLENLYRAWGAADTDPARPDGKPADRRGDEIIRDHLQKARAALLDTAGRRDAEKDFSRVASRLMPRVGPAFKDIGFRHRVIGRKLTGDGLHLHFVIDYPETMTYVEKRFLDEWGVSAAEVRRVAVNNLRRRTRSDEFKPLETGGRLYAYERRDTYDAARILLLEELLPAAGKLGFIASVPGRDLLLAYPLSPRRLTDLHQLVQIASHFHTQLTYPISKEVYWVRDGRISHVPALIEAGKVIVVPPDDMVRMLQEEA
jgi:uncharacterized protein YtpQ (UPF0354 family)